MSGPNIDGESMREIGTIAVLLLVSLVVIGVLMAAFAPGEATNQRFETTTDGALVSDDGFESAEVMITTGSGAEFGRLGGDVDAPATPVTDSNASIVGWAKLDENAAEWREYFVFSHGDELTLQFDQGEWLACANVTAGSNCVAANATSPYELTMVGVSVDGQNVTLIEGGVKRASASLASGNETPVVSEEWFGTLDELRTHSEPLTDSQLSTLDADPVAPVPGNRTARLMFDEGSGDRTWVLSQDSWAEMSGDVGWGDGLAREEAIAGEDYQIDMEEGVVYTMSNSSLEAADVGYISYGEGELESLGITDTILNAWNLGAVAILVIAAYYVLGGIGGFGNGRLE